MKNNANISRLLEIFWLIVFILIIILALYNTLKSGLEQSYMFFIMSAAAFLLYLARRSLRQKAEND